MTDLDTRLHRIREAVELWRRRVSEDATQLVKLVDTLITCSLREQEAGNVSNALDATREAVGHLHTLVEREPQGYRARLAKCLHLLSVRYAAVGSKDEALDAAQGAVALWRELTQSDPKEHEAECLRATLHLASCYAATRSPREALSVRHEALTMLEKLVGDDPSKYSVEFARQLSHTAQLCALQSRQAQSAELYRKAVTLWRRHAAASIVEHGPPLVRTLRSLAFELTTSGTSSERMQLRKEAWRIELKVAFVRLFRSVGHVTRTLGSK